MTPCTYVEDHQPSPPKTAVMHARTGKQFVVQVALEKATESESTITLTRREALRLLEMIENPPPRSKKFLQAQVRYRSLKNDVGSTA